MTSFLICIDKKIETYNKETLASAINLLQTLNTKKISTENAFFTVSYHHNAPLKGKKYVTNNEWIAVFAGDIIKDALNWNEILGTLKEEKYDNLQNLHGYFAIGAYHKTSNNLYIISDLRSQQPIYYQIDTNHICISTELSTFCRLPYKPIFNKNWLWEYLFFNFQILQTTFLTDVKRIPPASILKIDTNSNEYNIFQYSKLFEKKETLLKGQESLDHAYQTCKKTIPRYFESDDDIAMALTSGWDTRTNLSFCPDQKKITTYTYGIEGSHDLIEAEKLTNKLGLNHQKIYFNDNFVNQLEHLMLETVYCSAGLERISRASLLYAYRIITENAHRYPIIISGISWDAQFRGHALASVLYPDIARMLSTGKKSINNEIWSSCINDNYDEFYKHIWGQLDHMEKKYGDFSDAEMLLNYINYEVMPNYFAGELNIAKQFTTLRVPAWNPVLSKLAYSIENSTLIFSQYLPHRKRGGRDEQVLQSYLMIKNNRKLPTCVVRGVSPKNVLKGEFIYKLTRTMHLLLPAIKIKMTKKEYSQLEDWQGWLSIYKEFINDLIFSQNSKISSFIQKDFLREIQEEQNISIISNLATAEIIIRLIENNWVRFWQNTQ